MVRGPLPGGRAVAPPGFTGLVSSEIQIERFRKIAHCRFAIGAQRLIANFESWQCRQIEASCD